MSGCDGICGLHTDVLNRWLDFDVRCEGHGLEWFGTFTIGDLRLFMVGLEFGRSRRVHAGYPVLP
jgi:hypothetical protein